MTPEERALATMNAYMAADLDLSDGGEGERRNMCSFIASAIREAIEPYESTLSIIDSTLSGIPGESRAEKITNAIRNAENDALERAAAIADRENESESRELDGDYFLAARVIAEGIRALRHPAKGETA